MADSAPTPYLENCMSKFASPDQNTRLVATTQLLQKLQQNYEEMYQLTQDDISGIIQNLSDTNMKFQQTTCNVLQIIFNNIKKEDNEFTELMLQDFNLNFVMQQVAGNFKSARTQARQENFELANLIIPHIQNLDMVVNTLEAIFRTSKNAYQKQMAIELVQVHCQMFDQRQNQKLSSALQALQRDQNTEIRYGAQETIELLQQTEPSTRAPKSAMQKTQPLNRSQAATSAAAGRSKVGKPQAAKDALSYFPTPSESDQQAQNGPFSIVPPVQQSYLPFKPIYLFPIYKARPARPLQQIQDGIASGQQIKSVVTSFLDLQRKNYNDEKDWQKQMSAIQQIYQLLVLDNQYNNAQINNYIGGEICQFLQSEQTSKIIQSPRSTLSRESLIILEFVVQRYGPQCQPFVALILETLFANLARKGVYFECQSVSLLKSIIIHCNIAKSVYTKVVQQLKTQKVPSAKCYLLDLAFMCLLVMKINNQYDISSILLVQDTLVGCQQDKEGRVRQTARVFINALYQLDQEGYTKIVSKISMKDQQNLQQDVNFEAGYQTYSKKIICRTDEVYFPSFPLQSGACHQEIRPVFDGTLLEWRARLILDEEFQLFWDQEGQFTRQMGLGEEEELFGIPESQWVEYMNIAEMEETSQKPPTQSATQRSVTSKSRTNITVEDSEELTTPSNKIVTEVSQEPSRTQGRMNNQVDLYKQKYQDFNASISDDEILNALKQSSSSKQNTAIHMTQNIIEQTIMLQDIENDLQRIQQYLINDEMNGDQVDTLIQQILSMVFYQNEQITLQLQNVLLQILTTNELSDEQISLVTTSLVDLFNNSSLQVRRKSDEMLRTIIEIVDPMVIVQIFRVIIIQNKGNRTKLLNVNASLRLITYAVRKFQDRQQLLSILKSLVPIVIEQFQCPDANTRKTAVGCFIDLFMVVGSDFQVYVDRLSDVQLKLVVERMKMIKAKTGAAR